MKRDRICWLVPVTAILIATLAGTLWADDKGPTAQPLRVLLLSGQNNHDWRSTTPKLQSLLEDAGIRVEVTEHPEELTAEKLTSFDVILSNWNAYGKGEDAVTDWPDATKKAYVDFVRNGGGHVVCHAGSSSFDKWEDYKRITLAWWENGQTSHGRPHEFAVCVEASGHPITAGVAKFNIRDELWRRAGIHPDANVIASAFSSRHAGGGDTWEPIALTGAFGKGRCYTLLLGHDVKAMSSAGFAQLLVNGVYWAGKRPVPHTAKSALADADGGQTITLDDIAPLGKANSPDGHERDGGSAGARAAIDGNVHSYWDETDDQELYKMVIDFE